MLEEEDFDFHTFFRLWYSGLLCDILFLGCTERPKFCHQSLFLLKGLRKHPFKKTEHITMEILIAVTKQIESLWLTQNWWIIVMWLHVLKFTSVSSCCTHTYTHHSGYLSDLLYMPSPWMSLVVNMCMWQGHQVVFR